MHFRLATRSITFDDLEKMSSHFLGILRYFVLLGASLHTRAIAHLHLCYFAFLLPRDASAERGDATVSRLSVCLSVRL